MQEIRKLHLMKFFFLTTILLILGNAAISQNELKINFKAKSNAIVIDSVIATNLRTDQRITISGVDTLILSKLTDISDNKLTKSSYGYLYPNPSAGQSNLSVNISTDQDVLIRTYKATGQLLTQKNVFLNSGSHLFSITFPQPGSFYVSVAADNLLMSFKAVNTSGKTDHSSISYSGYGNMGSNELLLKSLRESSAENLFIYESGDIFHYKVFSGKETTLISEIPNLSKTHEVEFFECIDPDERNYTIIQIGGQFWMAENLAYLPSVSPSSQSSATTPYYYVYGYQGSDVTAAKQNANYSTYGVLYNWPAAIGGAASSNSNPSGVQGVCPAGWHLPSDEEWTQLENYLIDNSYNYDGTTIENKIAKSMAATTMWNNYFLNPGGIGNNLSINNKSGFSALPGGSRDLGDNFVNIGRNGFWWSSTEHPTSFNSAWHRQLRYDLSFSGRNSLGMGFGMSVRCIKDEKLSVTLPTLATATITAITQTTATGGGNVTADGGATVTARGICWSTSPNPTIDNNKTSDGNSIGSFTSGITGLTPNTPYFVRAYATNSAGTAYGIQVTFTTLQTITLPTVATATITDITQTTATGGGNVTTDGGATVTARGICWSTSPNPTIENSKTSDGNSTGSFTSGITGLTPNTPYYVRAYATNSAGTAYGSQVSFTTLQTITLPTVATATITDITQTTATGGGNVTADGGATVTSRGICWSTSPNPTIDNSKTSDGISTGSFTSNMTGLTPNTPYYVRAYATNSAGTDYGSQVTFTTSPSADTISTFTDPRDNKTYKTVKIGDQIWMAENLAYLPSVSSSSQGSGSDPYYYVYGYQGADVAAAKATDNYKTYGVLYNWPAAMAGASSSIANPSGVQGVCPAGWHLPSDEEWMQLTYLLGGASVAGGKLKETGTNHWATPNTGATNETGFTALPSGYCYGDGTTGVYQDIGSHCFLWSSTENGSSNAWFRNLYYIVANVYRGPSNKAFGYSVRCIKD